MNDPPCTCIGVREAVVRTLTGHELPPCALHDRPPNETPAVALNSRAIIALALGGQPSDDDTPQPPAAA